MLFKNKSKKSVLVRFSILIPVMLLALGFQSKKVSSPAGIISNELVSPETTTHLVTDTNAKYTAVEVAPRPSGGMREFYRFVGENYIYPKEAELAKVKARIVLSFVVERDGSLTEIKIIEDPGYGTGEAAVAMLEKSPKWTPGIQNGKPVRVQFTLPIQLNPKAEETKAADSAPATQ